MIKSLKSAVVAEVEEQTGISYEGLIQIKEASKRLAGLTSLFNKKAM